MVNRRSFLAMGAAALAMGRAGHGASYGDVSKLLTENGRYLPLLHAMQQDAPSNPALRDPLAQVLAMTGDEEGAMAAIAPHALAPVDPALCASTDALEAIVAAARSRQIVILNEAHHVSRCRVFAEALMTRLHGEGFRVFAAETFTNIERAWPNAAMQALNSGAPLTADLGWYMADPVYGELVRAARKLGYRFASYEVRPDQMQNAAPGPDAQREVREDAEANNFLAHILDADPKARVFVYCGYDHVLKAEVYNHQLWFAARLKAKSGIDPLCIGQAWTVPPPAGLPEDDSLAAILDHFRPTAPMLLTSKTGEPLCLSTEKKALDFEVIHPRLNDVSGRPGWLASAPGRKEARFKLVEIAPSGSLLQAIPAGEANTTAAIPSDQYPAPDNAREAVFFLKPGEYAVMLEDDEAKRPLGTLTV